MSLEDFSREVMGKPPKNRSWLDRAVFTDEDGCSYDRQVWVTSLPLALGLTFFGGILLIGWASSDPEWDRIYAGVEQIYRAMKWLVIG